MNDNERIEHLERELARLTRICEAMQAQLTLCKRAIEIHTRAISMISGTGDPQADSRPSLN